jgi:hypothetical protein
VNNIRSLAVAVRSWTARALSSPWGSLASFLAIYWCIGAGLRWRRRGQIDLFEILVMPAPFLMMASLGMAVLVASKAPVSRSPSFRVWSIVIYWWLFLTWLVGFQIWRILDPNASTVLHLPPFLSPKEWSSSYLGVWKDLLKWH